MSRTPLRWPVSGAVLFLIVFLATYLGACAPGIVWPERPTLIGPADDPTAAVWRLNGADGRAYIQQFRGGMKRALYVDEGGGVCRPLADLDRLDPKSTRHVIVMLDGVPFDLFEELYREGAFRLFHPPGQLVAPLPSSTEVSFPMMFEVTGTSALEAEFYLPAKNRVCGGTGAYLSGDNELWATGLDYRQREWMDGVGYLWPVWSTRREHGAMLGKARDVLRRQPEKRVVAVYGVCSDCLCHMVSREKAKEVLWELDRRLEQFVFETEGQVGLTILADHGNNMIPNCRRADIPGALERAGLSHVHSRGFRSPREVVVPRFGLVSFARAYCQNEEDRSRAAEAILMAEGVEHVLWRQRDVVYVRGRGGMAEIRHYSNGVDDYFAYDRVEGDPLDYKNVLLEMDLVRGAITHDGHVFYPGRLILNRTVAHDYPDALWRAWRAFEDAAMVIPDVLISLAPGWYYGSPGLDAWTGLNGTHGGLRRADTNTFFTSTAFVPPVVLRATDVPGVLRTEIGWEPHTLSVDRNKLLRFFRGDDGGKVGRRNLP